MPTNPRCKGSFKVGTACADCLRCEERGYDAAAKEAAIEAEKERTKDLPASRVKSRDPQPVVIVAPTPEPEPEA